SMYISWRALAEQFDPRGSPPETYLLCELWWGNSERFWIHWVRNDNRRNRHAEVCFLEEIFELRSLRSCHITWYLSWSPCANCCDTIRDFRMRHRNVNIDIHVARLHFADREETRRGLRDLASLQGVNHLASISPDYSYCWETFLQQGVNFWPVDFQPAITWNNSRLNDILEVSTL
ncbi:ABEC1 enzyme, partial [Dryoscopus gambensis]|nr:ABEC1 enzyme [Dryoscopus gambensis]